MGRLKPRLVGLLKAAVVGIAAAFILCGVSFAQTCPAYTYTLTNGTTADATQVMANFNTVRTCVNAISQTVLRGYIAGLTLSTAGSSGTFGISSGVATDSTAASSMTLPSAYLKTVNAWTLGTGSGCLDTGAIANNTWYHVFLIQRTDTGVVDVLCSTSATAPTLPSPYTLFRRIGSMKTNGSAQWIAFTQNGDQFFWTTPANDYSGQTVSTAATTLALSTPPGVRTMAIFNWAYHDSQGSNQYVLFNSMDQVAATASALLATGGAYNSAITGGQITGALQLQTDLSSQIRVTATTSTGAAVWIYTQGWSDARGKNN